MHLTAPSDYPLCVLMHLDLRNPHMKVTQRLVRDRCAIPAVVA